MTDGPWTKYQDQSSSAPQGPWTKYAAPKIEGDPDQPPAFISGMGEDIERAENKADERLGAAFGSLFSPPEDLTLKGIPLWAGKEALGLTGAAVGSALSPFTGAATNLARAPGVVKTVDALVAPEIAGLNKIRDTVPGLVSKIPGVGQRVPYPHLQPPTAEDIGETVTDIGSALLGQPEEVGAKELGGMAAQRAAAVKTARDAGYVLHPKMISEKPGIVANALAGWSGKVKTLQAASEKNQNVTNALSRTDLGLPEDSELLPTTFDAVRNEAGKAYQAVRDAVPVIRWDKKYADSVAKLGGKGSDAQRFFPKITKNPGIDELVEELKNVGTFSSDAALDVVKELRASAKANLKAAEDPSKHQLGLAQRQAADLVDDLVERNLEKTGQKELIDNYKKARQQIAKSYDIEAATNPATGDVSALSLAKLSKSGKPFTGNLKTISDSALAFPKAMQNISSVGVNEPVGVGDFFGAGLSAMSGHPEGTLAFALRAPSRAAVLSKPIQALADKSPAREAIMREMRRIGAVSPMANDTELTMPDDEQ